MAPLPPSSLYYSGRSRGVIGILQPTTSYHRVPELSRNANGTPHGLGSDTLCLSVHLQLGNLV